MEHLPDDPTLPLAQRRRGLWRPWPLAWSRAGWSPSRTAPHTGRRHSGLAGSRRPSPRRPSEPVVAQFRSAQVRDRRADRPQPLGRFVAVGARRPRRRRIPRGHARGEGRSREGRGCDRPRVGILAGRGSVRAGSVQSVMRRPRAERAPADMNSTADCRWRRPSTAEGTRLMVAGRAPPGLRSRRGRAGWAGGRRESRVWGAGRGETRPAPPKPIGGVYPSRVGRSPLCGAPLRASGNHARINRTGKSLTSSLVDVGTKRA